MIFWEAWDEERNCGPDRETEEELLQIILGIMKPYNMHHVPSEEMPELDVKNFYLCQVGEQYVGAAGYKMQDATTGKTTLLAVLPESAGQGIGLKLQQLRVHKMKELGAKEIITNSDRPKTITWYKKQGYEEVGKLKKLHSFGSDEVDHWTTLRLKVN